MLKILTGMVPDLSSFFYRGSINLCTIESLSFTPLMYRNYVVQHLLGMKIQEVTKYLLKRFQGCFVALSCNKYASNVVEKLLQSGEEVSIAIIMELLRSSNASMLLVDPFGNFVIQTALSVSKVRYPSSAQLGNSNINQSTSCFDVFFVL